MELILIRPYGFDITDKSVAARAGLDYWQHVRTWPKYDDWQAFLADRAPRRDQLFLFEDDGTGGTVYDPAYPCERLSRLQGAETKGPAGPRSWRAMGSDRTFRLPMRSPHNPVAQPRQWPRRGGVIYQAMRGWLA